MIQRFHNNLIKQEVEKCLDKQTFISSEHNLTTKLLDRDLINTDTAIEHSIRSFATSYLHKNDPNSFYQILSRKGTPLYTDEHFPIVDSPEELKDLSPRQMSYVIRPLGSKHYLYVASCYFVINQSIILYSAKDISSIYNEKNDYYSFFIKLDIFICSMFAFFMFFISRQLTRPIQALTHSTREIASGKFSERIPIYSKDEFGSLSKDFNSMADTIEEKINELEFSNAAQKTFINNFTHELKTPLTSIIGYANILRSSKYNEKLFIEASDYIYKEGKHLEKVSLKMMDLIYARSSELELIPLDIPQLLAEVQGSLKARLDEKEVTLEISAESYIFSSDPILMRMLLSNLIENAIKASKPHSSIQINLNVSSKVTLSIIDHGIGISPEHLNRLCEPFYMVDKARSRKNHGAGIGLSICKEIANLHHIELSITSQVQKGTTITLVFPNES